MGFDFNFIVVLLVMMEAWWSTSEEIHAKHSRRKRVKGPCAGGKWIEFGSYRLWHRVKCGLRRSDLADMASMEPGPDRNLTYDPNYGFEPYWADGDWVFKKKDTAKGDSDQMCGTKCSKLYTEYGTICGRNLHSKYKTFDNYCQLKNEDCTGLEKWLIVYKGPCYRQLDNYERDYARGRAKDAIFTFMSHYKFTQSYVGFCSEKPGPYAK